MPLEKDEVRDIREDIEDQLKREKFNKGFPNTRIAYGAGNPNSITTLDPDYRYAHIVKFVGLAKEPQPASLTSILNDKPLPDDILNRSRPDVKTRGEQMFEEHQRKYGAKQQDRDPPPEDDASAGPGGPPSEDTASAETVGAPSENATGTRADDPPPEEATSVEDEGVAPDADNVADGQSPATA